MDGAATFAPRSSDLRLHSLTRITHHEQIRFFVIDNLFMIHKQQQFPVDLELDVCGGFKGVKRTDPGIHDFLIPLPV